MCYGNCEGRNHLCIANWWQGISPATFIALFKPLMMDKQPTVENLLKAIPRFHIMVLQKGGSQNASGDKNR